MEGRWCGVNFTMITADKLKVTLSAADLSELGVSYDSLDYTDPASRQLLLSLLEQGKERTGFLARKSRLYIEVFPSEDGGCIIFYTRLRSGQHPPGLGESAGPEAVVFAFDDAETLLRAATGVWARCGHRIYKSALYLLEGGYRLILYPLDYADGLSVLFLSEFARKVGEGEILAAFVEEHGSPIIEDRALDTLVRYFS